MRIGTIKEIKDHEERVGLTPFGTAILKACGHEVFVETKAGLGAGFSDKDYIEAGAEILDNPTLVAKRSNILVKVKEPVKEEFTTWLPKLNGQALFAYLHLSANKELAQALILNDVLGISYDTMEDEHGNIPALKPMSEIAGRSAILWAQGSNVHDLDLNNIVIIGGGVVGESAAKECAKQIPDASIYLFEKNPARSEELTNIFKNNQHVIVPDLSLLQRTIKDADVVIGAVLVKGAKAPMVLTEQDVALMKPGAIIVDVAIDQGGCIFGSRPTSFSDPTYTLNDKRYCCIPNLPGQLPVRATEALTKLTILHVLQMANNGIVPYLKKNQGLLNGVNTYHGKIRNLTIAKDLDMVEQYYLELKL